MQPPRTRVFRYQSPPLNVELVFAEPDATLRQYVQQYVGWFDRSSLPVCRRELPSGIVPLILNFDSIVRERKADTDAWHTYGRFTSGLHESYTIVESSGPGLGMQVNFTALGARLFFDRPLLDMTNRTVELDGILGSAANSLMARLYDAATWDHRFDILDREIAARTQSGRQPPAAVAWAWQQLIRTGGNARIARLVQATSWSERHFAAQFAEHLGLAPKTFARVLRFRRAVRLMTNAKFQTLTDIAHVCGYYDHAHFTRDFRAFAGVAPSGLLKSRLPEHAGFRSDG